MHFSRCHTCFVYISRFLASRYTYVYIYFASSQKIFATEPREGKRISAGAHSASTFAIKRYKPGIFAKSLKDRSLGPEYSLERIRGYAAGADPYRYRATVLSRILEKGMGISARNILRNHAGFIMSSRYRTCDFTCTVRKGKKFI